MCFPGEGLFMSKLKAAGWITPIQVTVQICSDIPQTHQLRFGRLSHYWQGFSTSQGGCLGFLNHQQYHCTWLVAVGPFSVFSLAKIISWPSVDDTFLHVELNATDSVSLSVPLYIFLCAYIYMYIYICDTFTQSTYDIYIYIQHSFLLPGIIKWKVEHWTNLMSKSGNALLSNFQRIIQLFGQKTWTAVHDVFVLISGIIQLGMTTETSNALFSNQYCMCLFPRMYVPQTPKHSMSTSFCEQSGVHSHQK